MRLIRRDFLKQIAGAFAAGALPAGANQEPHEPAMPFPSSARGRLSVTSYPFRAYIEAPTNRDRKNALRGFDLIEFPRMVAEKFGVPNVNPLGAHFRSTDSAYLDAFRKALSDAHSSIVDLGLGGGLFYTPDTALRQAAMDAGRRWIDVAHAVGSPSVRQHVNGKQNDKRDVELAAQSLGELADYGAKRNIVVNLENDNPVAEDPFFLVSVIEKAGNPYLRALPDFGNSLLGHDAAYNERAVTAMFKHVFNMCHVKNAVESDGGRSSKVDLRKMFAVASSSSYRGYFSMECDSRIEDPFVGTQKLVEETLKYLS